MMKASPAVGTTDPKSRDQRLANMAQWAQGSRKLEGAKYAVDFIKDDQIRANAFLKYANEFARFNYKERPKGVAMIDEAIGQIEKAGPLSFTFWEIGNARHSLIGFFNINDLTARTVRIINMFPTDGADAKSGSDERIEFMKLARGIIPCAAYIFRPTSPGTAPAPDPELANGLKVRELRLAAKIEAEKFRKYPLVP